MFKKILFPINSLERSEKTINYVKALAKKYNSEVIILSSFDISEIAPGPLVFSLEREYEENIFFAYKSALNEIRTELEKDGIKIKSKLEKGKPGPFICQTAESENCDLIVMSKRGLGTINSYLLGSISNYVVHHATCPVFLIDDGQESEIKM